MSFFGIANPLSHLAFKQLHYNATLIQKIRFVSEATVILHKTAEYNLSRY